MEGIVSVYGLTVEGARHKNSTPENPFYLLNFESVSNSLIQRGCTCEKNISHKLRRFDKVKILLCSVMGRDYYLSGEVGVSVYTDDRRRWITLEMFVKLMQLSIAKDAFSFSCDIVKQIVMCPDTRNAPINFEEKYSNTKRDLRLVAKEAKKVKSVIANESQHNYLVKDFSGDVAKVCEVEEKQKHNGIYYYVMQLFQTCINFFKTVPETQSRPRKRKIDEILELEELESKERDNSFRRVPRLLEKPDRIMFDHDNLTEIVNLIKKCPFCKKRCNSSVYRPQKYGGGCKIVLECDEGHVKEIASSKLLNSSIFESVIDITIIKIVLLSTNWEEKVRFVVIKCSGSLLYL